MGIIMCVGVDILGCLKTRLLMGIIGLCLDNTVKCGMCLVHAV